MTHDEKKKAKTEEVKPRTEAEEIHLFEPEGEEPDLVIGEGSYGDDEAFDEVPFVVGVIPARFSLGRLVATPGALEAMQEADELPTAFIGRHIKGDWGEVCAEDAEENELSLKEGFRVLSAYRTSKGKRLWVITEADRSVTTILLPEEY